MGDGIMAVFGAPIEQPDHADRALAATREMLFERLPRFNEWMREQGLGEGFPMGIGLNARRDHVGTGGIGAADGVHGRRRYGEHRGPSRGDDQRDTTLHIHC